MSILFHYYNDHPDNSDEFDSSFSITVALVVLSLILGIGFIYGFSNIRRNNTSAEASLESSLGTSTVERTSPSHYPEPGSLTY